MLENSGYTADILKTNEDPSIFRYEICKKGSPEVLRWGMERTLEAAKYEAECELANYVARQS
jgi:hypothetical protein